MAKFVLAGEASCPSYARAELLADTLAAKLPSFKVTKVSSACCISQCVSHASIRW